MLKYLSGILAGFLILGISSTFAFECKDVTGRVYSHHFSININKSPVLLVSLKTSTNIRYLLQLDYQDFGAEPSLYTIYNKRVYKENVDFTNDTGKSFAETGENMTIRMKNVKGTFGGNSCKITGIE